MHTYHVFISGFRQRVGVTNGIARLALAKKKNIDPNMETVEYSSHRMDTLDFARFLAVFNGYKRVCLYAYSYGCHTACKLAWDLEEVGLRANVVVLCDPVAKYRYLYTMAPRCIRNILSPLPLIGRPTLKLPSSVGTVFLFEQNTAPPWPSKILHGKNRVKPEILPYPHTAMDNAEDFCNLVLSM